MYLAHRYKQANASRAAGEASLRAFVESGEEASFKTAYESYAGALHGYYDLLE